MFQDAVFHFPWKGPGGFLIDPDDLLLGGMIIPRQDPHLGGRGDVRCGFYKVRWNALVVKDFQEGLSRGVGAQTADGCDLASQGGQVEDGISRAAWQDALSVVTDDQDGGFSGEL